MKITKIIFPLQSNSILLLLTYGNLKLIFPLNNNNIIYYYIYTRTFMQIQMHGLYSSKVDREQRWFHLYYSILKIMICYNQNSHFNRAGGGGEACGNVARVQTSRPTRIHRINSEQCDLQTVRNDTAWMARIELHNFNLMFLQCRTNC